MKKNSELIAQHSGLGWGEARTTILCLCEAIAMVLPGAIVEAQQALKIPHVGFLSATSVVAISARVEGFRRGLHELGYVEGKNIVIEWRFAEGNPDRLSELAAELVRIQCRRSFRLVRLPPALPSK
jgi:hypothetical protein